ncbi:MAG TPA: SEC-C metal-binding domain-containing protein [Candidatus Lokiarchaeia archaeon]|nr:SEC-C metal-binding domain-containing protein [Candidatus Lokiarchaeia archaeon]
MGSHQGIQPSDFYTTGEEKRNINWYCYEMALGFESQLEMFAERPVYKKWIRGDIVQPMAIDLSNQLKQMIVTKQLTTATSLSIAAKWVKRNMPGAPNSIIDDLVGSLNETIYEQAASCKTCPTHCLKHKDTQCPMFDDPVYSKPLSDYGNDEEEIEEEIDEEDEDEYSDEKLDANVDKAIKYWKEFSKSELFSGLTENEKEESYFVVESFADYMYSYNMVPVEKWNVRDMEEICTDVLPRKITSDDNLFKTISPVLSAFFQFLGSKGGIIQDAESLSSRVRAIGPMIVKNARDPENWGLAKSFAMLAKNAGFDITDENDMHRAMIAYNAQALSNAMMGKRFSPAALNAQPVVRKIGRNERCPCGSGLKYKRCCGSNKK